LIHFVIEKCKKFSPEAVKYSDGSDSNLKLIRLEDSNVKVEHRDVSTALLMFSTTSFLDRPTI